MKTIKKNIKTTTITAVSVEVVNGTLSQVELEPLVTVATVTDKNAERLYRKIKEIEKSVKLFITSIHTDVITYEMSVDDFIKNATKITE